MRNKGRGKERSTILSLWMLNHLCGSSFALWSRGVLSCPVRRSSSLVVALVLTTIGDFRISF